MESRPASVRKSKKKHHQKDSSDDNSNDNVTASVKDKKSERRRKKRDSSSTDDNSNDNSSDNVKVTAKEKKSKSRRKERISSSSDDNWVEREPVSAKDANSEKSAQQKDKKKSHKKSKKRRKERESIYNNWIECLPLSTNITSTDKPLLKRDDWMTVSQGGMLKTYTKERKEPTKPNEKVNQIDAYDPSKSKYELNPYWKSNGTGLPGFQKPKPDERDEQQQTSVRQRSTMNLGQNASTRNWQKPSTSNSNLNSSSCNKSIKPDDERDASVRQKSTMNQGQDLTTRNWQKPSNSNSNLNSSKSIKPDDERDASVRQKSAMNQGQDSSTRNWQKPSNSNLNSSSNSKSINMRSRSSSPKTATDEEDTDPGPDPEPEYVSDEQINKLAAQQLKAELKGKTEKAARLQHELAFAKSLRVRYLKYIKETAGQQQNPKEKQRPQKNHKEEEHVVLTRTDASGNARPLMQSRQSDATSLYGGRKGEKHSKKNKRQDKMDTHDGDGQRVRYFADDDRYSLKEMFEREKLPETAAELEAQYARMVAKHKNPNDDLEDIFTDEMRMSIGQANHEQRELQRAIRDHQKLTSILENCDRCFESGKFDKDLLIATGNKIYLSLPWHVGLQKGHCILTTMEHVSCCTQLDEDIWEELSKFRSALTRMFGDDIIFYEIANNLHKRPHLSIHCIPIPWTHGEIAPFYFKKAIEESEAVWSINKQVIPLGKKSLRAAIPKGLPYVWVNFGMGQGFAHVIEDQDRFPATFVQEIICGMLELEPKAWRKPHKERNPLEKVKTFNDKWKNFDCTKS